MHIDFQRVDATHPASPRRCRCTSRAKKNPPAVKLDHCLVNHVVTELEINCLPADLPEFIEVDLGGLTKGQTLHRQRHQAAQGHEGRDARQVEPGDGLGRCAARRRRSRSGRRRRCRRGRRPLAAAGKAAQPSPLPRHRPRSKPSRACASHERPASVRAVFLCGRHAIIAAHDQVVRRPRQPGPGVRSHAAQRRLLVDRRARARARSSTLAPERSYHGLVARANVARAAGLAAASRRPS